MKIIHQPLKAVTCADGFNISIQGSYPDQKYGRVHSMYDRATEKFTEVELGFPSETDELIAKYAEDQDDQTNTIYSYVPVEIVNKLIKKHGGAISGEAPVGVTL